MLFVRPGFFKIPSWPVLTNFTYIQVVRPFGTDLLHWEWLSLLLSALVCINPWVIPAKWLSRVRLQFHRWAQNRSRAIWICALFPVVVRIALLPVVSIKPPSIHDEFSWLLMADTFRSGRLTNPTHLFWQHFETIHVIQRPTYNSMYAPGVGAILALGALLGDPWIGILISIGLMCGAICWMLQAWLPPAWACGGALVAAAQIGIGSCWVNSYVGGAPLPAMAGALLVGALPRLLRKPTPRVAAIFAASVVLLVNTRPFEGAVFSICCFAIILWRLRAVRVHSLLRWQIFAPAILILALGAAFTAYYSWRVTGNPLKMPYVVNRETYGWPENLAILPPQKLTYRHKILENMHIVELGHRGRYATFGRMLNSWGDRAAVLWEFYIGPGLTLPLLFLPVTLRNRKYRWPFYLLVFMLALNALQLMAHPQHVAAEAAIFYLLLTAGMRQLYIVTRRRVLPERVMAMIALCVVSGAALTLFLEQLHPRTSTFWEWPHWKFADARAGILSKLEQMPGKHLVFVRYGPTHTPDEEWVYNSADIDHSKIVWANSIDARSDMALRGYCRDRQVWVVEPDKDPTGFLPLTGRTCRYDR
jgi:hypothetical protein